MLLQYFNRLMSRLKR